MDLMNVNYELSYHRKCSTATSDERDLHSISRYRTGKNARWRNASFLSAKTRRTASQFRRHVTGTCGLARMRKKYNAVLTACGTPLAAASSCVADFFRDVFVERRALALRCVMKPRERCCSMHCGQQTLIVAALGVP